MADKTVIVVSGSVDATIKEYQPDVDFRIFHSLEALGDALDKIPIRAQSLFFTKDVVGTTNSAFTFMKDLVLENDYLAVDKVYYITEEDSHELVSLEYLIDNFELNNWEIITGSLTRAFITEVINGTFRDDKMSVKRMAVYRRPRADYVKQQLRNQESLDEDYPDDEHDLMDIPDEEVPEQEPPKLETHLRRVYIAGLDGLERSAFAFIAAQYLALTEKVLLVESDAEYHRITEFATKSEVDAYTISLTDLYENAAKTIDLIRKSAKNLVIVQCIDRLPFDYKFICSLLYYNLVNDFTYLIYEIPLEEILQNTPTTVTVPSTVIGTLQTGEGIDRSFVSNCHFVGVNLKQLPDIHINSGVVMGTILNDILSVNNIVCPVVTLSCLRLKDAAYDLGELLGRSVLA